MTAELDEWRCAVRDLTEVESDRNIDSRRASLGVIGDKYDDKYGGQG